MDHSASRPRIVVIWRGSDADPRQAARYEARLAPVMDVLRQCGLAPEPLVYFDRNAGQARDILKGAAGVLVWVNPLAEGQTRATLNELLREAAKAGAFVSAHPDVIDAMGTKRVLFDTRDLSWSADVDLYLDTEQMADRLLPRLAAGEARVLKPLRGNDGQGVVKLKRQTDGAILLQRANDDQTETHDDSSLLSRLATLFVQGGQVIDQAFNDNAQAGMVRCYVSQNRVAGFALQRPRLAGAGGFAMQSDKQMLGPDAPDLQDLRNAMESEWIPGLQRRLAIETRSLPVIWDADFLVRPRAVSGGRFVLCEINVSCVSPFPDTAPGMLAEAAARAIFGMGRTTTELGDMT